MSDPVIIVLGLTGLALLALLYAWARWLGNRSPRYLVRAIGLVLVLVALFVTGVADLLLQGLRALWGWLNIQVLDTRMWIGVGLAVVGVLAFLIGGTITPPTRAEVKQARLERRAAVRAERQSEAVAPASSGRPAPVAAAPREQSEPTIMIPPPLPGAGPATGDDEMTAILKKHDVD